MFRVSDTFHANNFNRHLIVVKLASNYCCKTRKSGEVNMEKT